MTTATEICEYASTHFERGHERMALTSAEWQTLDAERAAREALHERLVTQSAQTEAELDRVREALRIAEANVEQEKRGRIQAQEDREMFARNAASRLDLIGKQNEKIFRMRDLAEHALSHLSNGETQSLRKALEEIAATPL